MENNYGKLDLTRKLRSCFRGLKLYSVVHGEVVFKEISLSDKEYPIVFYNTDTDINISFTKEGKLYSSCPDGEVVLFPSKDNRDWSKFVTNWKDLKKDTYVYCFKGNPDFVDDAGNIHIHYRDACIRKYAGNHKVYDPTNEKISWNYIIPINRCKFEGNSIVFDPKNNYE